MKHLQFWVHANQQKSAGTVCLATDCAVVPKPVPVGGGLMLAVLIICVAYLAMRRST